MKRRTFRLITTLCVILMTAPLTEAQFLEDALRLNYGILGSGSRPLSMGMAYVAVADDFSASFYNPAGLAQVRQFEVSGGLRHTTFRNNTFYLGSRTEFSGTSTNLDNLGLVIPVPTVRGSLTFAIGYNRVNDFTQVSSFEGFNETDSIIPDLFYSRDQMSYILYLADSTGATPIMGDVFQNGLLEEKGSVNNWSLSGGIEVIPDFFLGATLNLISGRYRQSFLFEERDIYNVYTVFPYDFEHLRVEDNIDAQISGFNAVFGGLYTVNDILRIGATVQTPTRYSIEENYDTYGRSQFTTPDEDGFNWYEDSYDAFIDYGVSTPWKFSAGASVSIAAFTVAASIEYQDWTQLEFRNAPSSILAINRDIRTQLQATTNINVGGEFRLPLIPVVFRGGFIYQPSPYRNAPPEFDRKYITGGVGLALQNAVTIDVGFIYGLWESDLFIYDYPTPQTWRSRFVSEDIRKSSLVFTLRYRF